MCLKKPSNPPTTQNSTNTDKLGIDKTLWNSDHMGIWQGQNNSDILWFLYGLFRNEFQECTVELEEKQGLKK